ncbi:MAG: hypothetical protein M5U34_36585 [Chloroflexi bacterium]|nr:hypothetical protein [Chloroflexota bacterium]
MTLEFEKLTPDLEQMALTIGRRLELQRERLEVALETLKPTAPTGRPFPPPSISPKNKGTRSCTAARPSLRLRGSARRRHQPARPAPPRATLIATDGSQIMPDRHAAYLYYLINVGGIVYHHGRSLAPETFAFPQIEYPQDDAALDAFNDSSGYVSIKRDLAEIETLAKQTFHHRHDSDLTLAILDQRLLCWPIGGAGIADNAAVTEWGSHMTADSPNRGAALWLHRPAGNHGRCHPAEIHQRPFRPIIQLAHPEYQTSQPGIDRPRHFLATCSSQASAAKVFVNVSPAQRNLHRPRPR